jgi:hypothetical protein
MEALSKFGETGCGLDRFSMSTSVSRGYGSLMDSDSEGLVNIGSEEMVTINRLAENSNAHCQQKPLSIRHTPGPLGVRGRNSDIVSLSKSSVGRPSGSLADGMANTYEWTSAQVKANAGEA